jgi:hypothetical protein
MTYDISHGQWEAKMELNSRLTKPRPTPMRPLDQRLLYETQHFLIMEGATTAAGWSRRGKKLALIEKACSSTQPTRIDARLKSIRQIIAIREIFNMNHAKACHIHTRYWKELMALIEKCEQLYPCHFLIKGVNYEPQKTVMAVEHSDEKKPTPSGSGNNRVSQ